MLALTALLIGAWAAFTIHLGAESMWSDEYTTWHTTNAGLSQLVQITAADVHPPLYYGIVWLWRLWTASDDLTIMRLSSAFVALIGVALCYRVGRDWFGSRTVGIGAAAFLASSGIYIYYARDLRMYPLVVLLTLLSWWLLWRLVNRKPRGIWGYALCVSLMAYTYYYLAFIVLVQIVVVIVFHRARLRPMILAVIVAGVTVLPWLPTFIGQMTTAKAQSGSTAGPIIGKFLGTVPTSVQAVSDFVALYTAKEPVFVLFLLILGFGALANLSRRRRSWVWAVALWLLLTVTLFFVINLVIPIYGPRYVLFVIPAIALLIGLAIARLPGRWTRALAVLTLSIGGMAIHTDGFQLPHVPHRDLLGVIATHYLPGDRIWYELSSGALGSSLDGPDDYYMAHQDSALSPSIFVWGAPDDYKDIHTTPRVWVVRPYWITPPPQTVPLLVTGRTITEQTQIGAYTVSLYEAQPAADPLPIGDLFKLKLSPLDRTSYKPGDVITLTTWWQATRAQSHDYSLGLYLQRLGTSTPVAQGDQALMIDGQSTGQIVPDGSFGLARPTLTLPATLPAGTYEIWASVYFWQDPTRLPIAAQAGYTVDSARSTVRLGQIQVLAAS